jgi:hypothetical protein
MISSNYGFKVAALVVWMDSIRSMQNHYKHKQIVLCRVQGVGLGFHINRLINYMNSCLDLRIPIMSFSY